MPRVKSNGRRLARTKANRKKMEKTMAKLIGQNQYYKQKLPFWNFIFGITGTVFLIWSIIEESLIKLIGAFVFFMLAKIQN